MSLHSPRGIFCSRTLNLRSISAIGYDMDYTLIHYSVMVLCKLLSLIIMYELTLREILTEIMVLMQAWEGRAYDYGMANLKSMGFPVDGLTFDPNLVNIRFPLENVCNLIIY